MNIRRRLASPKTGGGGGYWSVKEVAFHWVRTKFVAFDIASSHTAR